MDTLFKSLKICFYGFSMILFFSYSIISILNVSFSVAILLFILGIIFLLFYKKEVSKEN